MPSKHRSLQLQPRNSALRYRRSKKVIGKAPDPELGQRDTFVSLGGGVIGDICGFAASQFLRGNRTGATLNLGHTFGDAIETKGGYGQWLHGEVIAVARSNIASQWTQVVAVDLSHHLGLIDDSSVQ
ncbi:hypothetical protein K1719_013163 [Acacia pycnantha]|nr:hypothetical protein K1719_013163 [Acacia pycnantha]